MSYIEKRLLPGENILVTKKMSKKCFIPAAIFAAIGIICIAINLLLLINSTNVGDTPYLMIAGACIVVIALMKILSLLFDYWSQEFVITDRRCIIKEGIITVSVLDMALDKCEGIAFSQGLWGRLLNYGSILATTGGVTNKFSGIDKPYEIRNQLNEIVENYKKSL